MVALRVMVPVNRAQRVSGAAPHARLAEHGSDGVALGLGRLFGGDLAFAFGEEGAVDSGPPGPEADLLGQLRLPIPSTSKAMTRSAALNAIPSG